MQQIHEGLFKVDPPDKYREIVQSGTIHKECMIRGNELISLTEKNDGVWEYKSIIKIDHPRIDELATLLDSYGIKYTLRSVPRVTEIIDDQIKIINEIKEVLSA